MKGIKACNCEIEDFGEKFDENDVIGCFAVSSWFFHYLHYASLFTCAFSLVFYNGGRNNCICLIFLKL